MILIEMRESDSRTGKINPQLPAGPRIPHDPSSNRERYTSPIVAPGWRDRLAVMITP